MSESKTLLENKINKIEKIMQTNTALSNQQLIYCNRQRKWKSEIIALREICHYQKAANLLIFKISFKRLVQEILQNETDMNQLSSRMSDENYRI